MARAGLGSRIPPIGMAEARRRGGEVFRPCPCAGEACVVLLRLLGLGLTVGKLIYSENGCIFKAASIFGTGIKYVRRTFLSRLTRGALAIIALVQRKS